MDATDAGGRNTQAQPTPGAASLEMDLQNVADSIAALLTDARAIDAERDEFGHARSRAYTDAVALLKVSAKLGHSIAALRGSKFEHNINVRREEIDQSRNSAPSSGEEEEATLMRLNPDTLWDWRSKRTYVLDPSRGPDGRPAREACGAGGTPLPISGGSNGNF
ncbi:MAG TPA: hypothetical protein VHW69_10000 [Rhizomicrobium sp.]|jgi:hypothetical protein|nr:hypothetical protein [Rhizomicrobium sp.]